MYRVADELHQLDAYQQLQVALRTDPVIAPQMDQLVGSAMSRALLQGVQLLDGVLGEYLDQTAALRLDEEVAERVWGDVEDSLLATQVPYVALAPLHGVEGPDDLVIQLTPQTEIARLEDDEIARCLRIGVIQSPFGDHPVAFPPKFCIRVHLETAKVIGDERDGKDSERAVALFADADRRIAEVLTALRLCQEGSFSALGQMRYSRSYFERGGISGSRSAAVRHGGAQYALRPEMTEKLVSIHGDLVSSGVQNSSSLQVALRRFWYAGERGRPDDQTIDLMIAAEALFLADQDSGYRGELRYRLALRCAKFVDLTGVQPIQALRFMMRAYDVRSSLVHGKTPATYSLPDDSKGDVSQFIESLERVIRLGLRRAVEVAAKEGQYSVAWDNLILGQQ